jgi:surfeit locus 1 family protein
MSSETKRPSTGFPVGLTIAAALAFALLCGLGAWQLQRLAWKQDLMARVTALQKASARPIAEALAAMDRGQDVAFTRVTVDCPRLERAPFVRLYALRDGQIGERLISACYLRGDGRSVLVDRGFLPDGARAPVVFGTAPMLTLEVGDILQVKGVLRRPDPASLFTPKHRPGGRWFARDLPAMARELSAPAPIPYFLAVETPTNPDDPALVPAPLPTGLNNPHLGYAITWFGLAAALAAIYAALLRQRLRAKA